MFCFCKEVGEKGKGAPRWEAGFCSTPNEARGVGKVPGHTYGEGRGGAAGWPGEHASAPSRDRMPLCPRVRATVAALPARGRCASAVSWAPAGAPAAGKRGACRVPPTWLSRSPGSLSSSAPCRLISPVGGRDGMAGMGNGPTARLPSSCVICPHSHPHTGGDRWLQVPAGMKERTGGSGTH